MAERLKQASSGAPRELDGGSPGGRLAWTEVSLDSLARNFRLIRAHVGPGRRIMAVVKANAYGHGAVPVARRLEAEGTDLFGVAFPEEGIELRRAEVRVPILVLGAASPGQIPEMTAASLTATAYSASFIEAILAAGDRAGRPVPFHLKVDTGMGRLGVLPEDLPEALSRLAASREAVRLEGVYTTLSCSDDPADPHTGAQIAAFRGAVGLVRQAGFDPRFVHAANSGGIIDHEASWLDTVRPGIMMYGIHPSERSSRVDLRPVLALKARLALVKNVASGTPLGYGRSFVTSRPSVIGTVPAGYADGILRRIAARGHVLVRGRRAPFAGRISMDNFTIDLTGIPGASEGDEVAILGRQGADAITAEQVAAWAETIPYEILSRLGPRLPRVYIEGPPKNSL